MRENRQRKKFELKQMNPLTRKQNYLDAPDITLILLNNISIRRGKLICRFKLIHRYLKVISIANYVC